MSKPTKILFIITKGNFGGAQRYVFDLATNLSKENYDIVVALGEGKSLEEKLLAHHINVIKIKSLERDIHVVKDFLSLFEIIKIIKKENPDIVHLNSSKAGLLGTLAVRILTSKNRRIKAIFTSHGWAFNEDRNAFSKAIISLLHWFTVLMSHRTITVSEKIKEQIKIFPFTKGKIVCIYNGIKSINFLDRENARNKLIPQKENQIWIGTIAELHKNKGIDFAILAFARIADAYRNTILVIIGEGEERKNLENLISSHNLKDRVYLLGFISEANTYLKAYDIGITPSRTDTLPYVPLEMGLAQLPVIASWVGGIPEIIVNGESGILTQKGDVQEIMTALATLIDDLKKRALLGENLYTRVQEKFTFEHMLQKTEILYRK